MKILIAILVYLVCAPVMARSYEDIIDSGYIEIAVYRDFPPYSFLADGEPVGIDIEVGKRIAEALGVDVRWFWLTADERLEDDLRNAIWKGAVTDVDKRKADLMLRVPYDRQFSYGIDGYGLPRNEMVHMFAPYHQESWAIARDLEQTGEVYNLAIFQYEKIGVEIDSLPDTFLTSTLQGRLRDNIIHYMSTPAALDALQDGEVAAVATLRSQIEWGLHDFTKNTEHRLDIGQSGMESLVKRQWDIGVAVKQDYRELANEVETLIDGWVRDGTLKDVFATFNVQYRQPSLYETAE